MGTGERFAWQDRAACRRADPELFFAAADQAIAAAKAVCATCAVRIDCLAFALAQRERYGVWGGASERERLQMTPGERAAILRRAERAA